MNQVETWRKINDLNSGYASIPQDKNLDRGILCFKRFRPYPKPEYPGIGTVYHRGNSCEDSTFHCFLEFTDGRIQEMPAHPPGECGWCDYLRFDVEE